MFFDTSVFIQFVQDCRAWGITCPIVPGLMCLNTYHGFQRMTKFCKTRVPHSLQTAMDALHQQSLQAQNEEGTSTATADAAMKQFGIEYGAQMCRDLMDFGVVALHFYTLNLEKVVYGILDALGYSDNAASQSDEADANTMQAVGSAWARVGDTVSSIFGQGVVTHVPNGKDGQGGATVIRLESWKLAGGQHPVAYLQHGQFEKVFK